MGLGGWLLLPLIPLVLAPLWVGQELVTFATKLRTTGVPALATEGAWYLGVAWWLVTSAGRAGLALLILPRYLRKHRSVPRLMVIFLLTGFVLGAVELVTGEARVAEQSVPALMIGMLIPLMWVGYFQFSDRVRRTFVR